MADTESLVTDSAVLPAETFAWGAIKWLYNGRLSPGAEQTLGVCHILPGKRNPLHFHPNCEELLYVLAGQGRHRLDDELVELRVGMTIRIPVGVKHNLENTGWEPLACVITFSSGDRQTVFLE
jgi:mannose-6-phosphate isomerase-like protein (cupin superfamily)